MNKKEFLDRLEILLSDLPQEEKADALSFYENYFEDAGPENEQHVLSELGSPEQVANSIRQNSDYQNTYNQNANYQNTNYQNTAQKNTYQKENIFNKCKNRLNSWDFYRENKGLCIVLLIGFLVITFPGWGGILGGLLGIILGFLGLLLALITITFSLAIAGILGGFGLMFAGATTLIISFGTGLFLIGLGAIFVALGLIFGLAGTVICAQFIPWMIRSIKKAFTGNNTQTGGAAA